MTAAARPDLVEAAGAVARNAGALLEDAEGLLAQDRRARAYSLAVLAVEEFGKAAGLLALAVMPDELRAMVPARDVRSMLEWHYLKQVGGLLMSAVQFGTPGVIARLAGTPVDELTKMLSTTAELARDSDEFRKRGLYVDIADDGSIRQPSDITESEARDQVERARAVAQSARPLTDPQVLALLANPPADGLALSSVMFGAYFDAGEVGGPAAAAAAVVDGVQRIRAHFGGAPEEA